MNPPIQLKPTTLVFLATYGLAWFGLSSSMEAVTPAPHGGYPGGNTAEGQAALSSLATGGFNTALGWFSLKSDTTGGFNTALGSQAGNTAFDVNGHETAPHVAASAIQRNRTLTFADRVGNRRSLLAASHLAKSEPQSQAAAGRGDVAGANREKGGRLSGQLASARGLLAKADHA